MSLIITWLVSAAALYIVTQFVPGIHVSGVQTTFIAALVIGLVNATLGNLLKILTLPIGCLTLGLSSLIINALMFMVAANVVSGFHVDSFLHALLGSLAMSVVTGGLHFLLGSMFSSGPKNP